MVPYSPTHIAVYKCRSFAMENHVVVDFKVPQILVKVLPLANLLMKHFSQVFEQVSFDMRLSSLPPPIQPNSCSCLVLISLFLSLAKPKPAMKDVALFQLE